MFIEKDNPDDPYKRQVSQPQQPGQQTVGAGGGGATTASGGTSSNPSTQNPISSQPTQQFANVQDYLGANKEQGNQLGEQFKGKLDNSLSTDKGAIDSAIGQTNSDIKANTTSYDSNLINTAVSDPTKVANNNDQLQSFMKQWNAAYTGPTSFESTAQYGNASNAATDASTKAAETADAGGRKQILQDQFGVYGQGNKGLDQTLLQNSNNFGGIQESGKQLGTIQDYLNQSAAKTNTAANDAAATTAKTQTDTKNAFNNSLTNLQSDLGKRVGDTQATATADTNQIKADLASGDANKISGDLSKFNLSDSQKANLVDYLSSLNKDYGKNIDLSNAVTFNPNTDISASNVATKADYDKAAALQKLTGQDYSKVLNPADASKADSWNTLSSSLKGDDIDTGLRNALIQSEIEKLNPAPGPTPGSSTPGQSTSKSLSDYLKGGAAVTAPLTLGTSAALGSAINKGLSSIGNSLSKVFGGGGHSDAQVTLPEFQMPNMGVPTKANAATMKQIVDVFNKPIPTNGSYHEGAVYDLVDRIGTLKTAHDQGQLSDQEYKSMSQPLIQYAHQAAGTILSSGSAAAHSVQPAYEKLKAYL